MIHKSGLRKALTFGADSLSIIAGSILCALLYHPEASVTTVGVQAFIPMLLITMAMIGAAMKMYQNPISENIAYSLLLSVIAFGLSLAASSVFLLLIDSRQLNFGFILNLFLYSVFFLSVYRLAFVSKPRADRPAGGSYIADSTVLVTGGAGAIGFELCRQLLRHNAKCVVIFDHNENKLADTEKELSLIYPKTRFAVCIGSVQDRARLREVFDLYRPQLVFHAASYKQVPMMVQNAQEALKNNVMGTLYMVEMAIKHRAERFILLSDDMAFMPTNILGASKRVAEMLIQCADEWGDTRFSAVRFGAAAGGSRNKEKYFMTMPEAATRILESGGQSKGGEILSLEMGKPIKLKENENPPEIFETVFDKLCQFIDDRDYGSALGKIGVLVPTFQSTRS